MHAHILNNELIMPVKAADLSPLFGGFFGSMVKPFTFFNLVIDNME